MKKLLTIKFSMINIININIIRIRGINVRRTKRKRRSMKTLILIPILGAISLYFIPSKRWALMISVGTMIEAIRLYIGMDKKSSEYQYVYKLV